MSSDRSGFRHLRQKELVPEPAMDASRNPFARGLRQARPNYNPDEGAAGGADVWAVVLALAVAGILVLGLGLLMAGWLG